MKKVLIICDYFPPQSGPRMGYLVKYLSKMGHECYVVAGDKAVRGGFEALAGFAKEVHVVPQKPHRTWNLLHALTLFWPYDYLAGEYEMLAHARRIVTTKDIDVVLSSCTFGFFPNNTASCVARENHLPLVIDIRDLMEQNPPKSFWRMYFRQKIDYLRELLSFISMARFARGLKEANALVTISPWHVQWLKDHYNANTHLIYNGYDPELFQASAPVKTSVFEIVYTGTLGTPQLRDYSYLLESVRHLHVQGVISPDTFRVKFYCGRIYQNDICERVASAGIAPYFEFLPFVPAAEVPILLRRASILLVLTNKNGYHGIMTTKFFEYLAMNRPILCVTSDEDCLEEAIRQVNAGCSARSVAEAEHFIVTLYNEWKLTGSTKGSTNMGKLALYSREVQAGQFVELFDSLAMENKL